MADNKGSTRNFIIIVLVVILFVNIASFLIGVKIIIPMFYSEDEFLEATQAAEPSQDVESGGERQRGIKKDLASINLNPAGSGGEIFSCDIVLEAENELVEAEITRRDYEIMDRLSTYLSFKTIAVLNEPKNWDKFKKDMLDIVNSILTDGEITSIHIPQKIIQFN